MIDTYPNRRRSPKGTPPTPNPGRSPDRARRRQRPPEPTLADIGQRLREAMARAGRGEKIIVQRAAVAGEWVLMAKKALRDNPLHLQSFDQWFRAACPGFSRRRADDYAKVYVQVERNKSRNYSSIEECLRDYRKAHPPRRRFTPPTPPADQRSTSDLRRRSREALDNAPPGPPSGPIHRESLPLEYWLDGPPAPAPTRPVRDALVFFTLVARLMADRNPTQEALDLLERFVRLLRATPLRRRRSG